jgi:hypothetical protein
MLQYGCYNMAVSSSRAKALYRVQPSLSLFFLEETVKLLLPLCGWLMLSLCPVALALSAKPPADKEAELEEAELERAEPAVSQQDIVGVFFDGEAKVNCISLPAGEYPAYLMVVNPSAQSGIKGWECSLQTRGEGQCMILDWGLQGKGINVATPPHFMVGLGDPLPPREVVLLLDMTLLLLDEGEVNIYLGPTNLSIAAEVPSYVPADKTEQIIPLNPASGDFGRPVAIINGDCPEGIFWRGVKSQHR